MEYASPIDIEEVCALACAIVFHDGLRAGDVHRAVRLRGFADFVVREDPRQSGQVALAPWGAPRWRWARNLFLRRLFVLVPVLFSLGIVLRPCCAS
jgi:hypothetical protein